MLKRGPRTHLGQDRSNNQYSFGVVSLTRGGEEAGEAEPPVAAILRARPTWYLPSICGALLGSAHVFDDDYPPPPNNVRDVRWTMILASDLMSCPMLASQCSKAVILRNSGSVESFQALD